MKGAFKLLNPAMTFAMQVLWVDLFLLSDSNLLSTLQHCSLEAVLTLAGKVRKRAKLQASSMDRASKLKPTLINIYPAFNPVCAL